MSLKPQQEHMNRALDEDLTGPELAAFQAALAADQERAAQFARLSNVDALLRHPPLASASPGFAARVMTRIEAGEHLRYTPQRRRGWLLLWGSLMAAAVILPLILVLAVAVPLLARPDALMATMQQIVPALGVVSDILQRLLTFVGSLIAAFPMAPALALTVIPMIMLWAWLVWYLRDRNRPQTIIIPVQAA